MKKILSLMMAMVMAMSVFTSCKSDNDEDVTKDADKGLVFGTWEITSVLGIDIATGETESRDVYNGTWLVFNTHGQYKRTKGNIMLDFLEPRTAPYYRGQWLVVGNKIVVTPNSSSYDFDLQISKDKMTWEGYYDQYSKLRVQFKKVSDTTDM